MYVGGEVERGVWQSWDSGCVCVGLVGCEEVCDCDFFHFSIFYTFSSGFTRDDIIALKGQCA